MKIIKNLLSLFWQDIINLIHLSPKKTDDPSVNTYAKELKKEGIIKIPNFLTSDLCDELRNEIENFSAQYPTSIELENGTKLNYRGQHSDKASDSGMLDIFFIEKSIPRIATINQEKLIQILTATTGQQIIPLRANAYLNNGIKNTRGYHIDNTQPVIYKAFVYLVNVPDLSYGPYSFVKRSHQFSLYSYLSLIKNLFSTRFSYTDMSLYNKERVQHCIGNKGDLILSSQNGIHRGLPQEDGKKRVALILSFMVKSKLSYIHQSAKENISQKNDKK